MGPLEEIVDAGCRVAVDDPSVDVGEGGLGINAVALGCLDGRVEDWPVPSVAVEARENRLPAIQGNMTDCVLDNVEIDFNTAVIDEAAKALHECRHMADRLGTLRLPVQEGKLVGELGPDGLSVVSVILVAYDTAFIGARTARLPSNSSCSGRANDARFLWERCSGGGEVQRHFYPKEYCLEREPLLIEADGGGLLDQKSDAFSFILVNPRVNPST